MRLTFLLPLLLCTATYSQQITKHVLFIGNSYTYVNDLPGTLANLAHAAGDSLYHDQNTIGGYTFQLHSSNAATLAKIAQGGWDNVVLQEQSQLPSFPPSQVATSVYPYARQLDSLIHVADPCTETVFYMTWGRKTGDSSNCASWPPICTFDGMNYQLRQGYLQMATDNNAAVSPVGVAWKIVRDSFPAMNLYQSDGSHPVMNGTYLAACTFYAVLFGKSPIGLSYTAGLPASDAANLQRIASRVVFDSLAQWRIGAHNPVAGFSYNTTALTVSAQYTGTSSAQLQWDFGDSTALATGASPAHTYSQPGTYTVTLTVTDACHRMATSTQQVTVVATSVQSYRQSAYNFVVYPVPANAVLTIRFAQPLSKSVQLELVALSGAKVLQQAVQQQESHIDTTKIPAGDYYIRVGDRSEKVTIVH